MSAEDIAALLASAPLVDGHNDLLWELRVQAGYDLDRLDVAGPVPSLHTDLPRLRAGRVGAQFWSLYVPSDLPGDTAVTATLEQLDGFHQLLRRYPADLGLALTADDVERVQAGGRIASLAGMEGGQSIGCSLAALRMMYALGARYLTLTHDDNTPWADSATDEPRHGGLAPFGVHVVRELNRLGMLVDLSHVAATTMSDALDVSVAPVIFSHSNARALCDHPRNVPDEILARLAAGGGVCMATFAAGFVAPAAAEGWLARSGYERRLRIRHRDAPVQLQALMAEWDSGHDAPAATLAQVADHIDHIRDVAGIDHIGIGSDFDGVPFLADGLSDVSGYPRLFDELRRRGYSNPDLRKVAGRNVLRTLRAAEEVARALASGAATPASGAATPP